MIGQDLRGDLPLFDVKMREKVNFDYVSFTIIGFLGIIDYYYSHVGNSSENISNLIEEKLFASQSENINLILGSSFYQTSNSFFKITDLFDSLKKKYTLFKLFLINSMQLTLIEIGHVVIKFKLLKKKFTDYFSFIYNFNANDETNINNFSYKKSLFIYQGHHGGYLASYANIFLPTRFYFEKSFVYLNIFGLVNNFIYSTYRFFVNNIKTD